MRNKARSWTGVIFAAGATTTLYPATSVVPKGLIPIYDKPLIYYPISVLMLAGIRRIALIAETAEAPIYRRLLDDGHQFGLEISYFVHPASTRQFQSLLAAQSFIGIDNIALISGDCLIYADRLQRSLADAMSHANGIAIFGHPVTHQGRRIAVTLREDGTPSAVEHSPAAHRSTLAVVSIAFCDNFVFDIVAELQASKTGPLDDIDVFHWYLARDRLHVHTCGRGFAWLDTSTHTDISAAAGFIQALESNHGLKIGCLEEIAYRRGYLSAAQLSDAASQLNNGYGAYLRRLIQ